MKNTLMEGIKKKNSKRILKELGLLLMLIIASLAPKNISLSYTNAKSPSMWIVGKPMSEQKRSINAYWNCQR